VAIGSEIPAIKNSGCSTGM